jgi:Outer membrane protein beta-barrel domain
MRATLIIALIAGACINISAQRYTYLGGGIGLISARFQVDESLWLTPSPSLIDGGSYDAYLRQELTSFLSIEVGYSWRNYDFEYVFPNGAAIFSSEGFWAHQIPINIDMDVEFVKDRISGYGTFGYLICLKQATGQEDIYTTQDSESIIVEWAYTADSDYASQFTVGFGSRFRLFDDFLLDLEIGNAFSLKSLREYKITYMDQLGNAQTKSENFHGNYWYMKIRFSYPLQRVVELVREGINGVGSIE